MKSLLLLLNVLLLSVSLFAEKESFLAKQGNIVLRQDGDCLCRHSPCSTFKIPLSLMFYDYGLLINENEPELPFKDGYVVYLPIWKGPHNPTLWMKNSCVWFSQVFAQRLGVEKLRDYVAKFNYGNCAISGDTFWLSGSLEISVDEQILFLQKLVNNELPVTVKSHDFTKKILFMEELQDGWKLYGKTGCGFLLNQDKTKELDIQFAWFVGWLERGDRSIVFAQYLEDEEAQSSFASVRATTAAKEKLLKLTTVD